MKHTKRIFAILLSLAMMIAMSATVFAAAGEYTITVNNPGANATINGKTFSAIKLFDTTYNGDAVSYKTTTSNYFLQNADAKKVLEKYFTFTPSASDATKLAVTVGGTLKKTELTAADMYDMTAELNAISGLFAGATVAATSPAASNNTAVIDVGAPGYYFVTGSGLSTDGKNTEIIAATALTTAKPKATINAKLEGPQIDKKIDANSNKNLDTEDVTGNNKAIGDKVDYVVKGTVPDMTGFNKYYYIVTDSLSGGLTYNNDAAVTIDGKTIAQINEGKEAKDQIGYTVYYKKASDSEYGTALPTGYKAGDALDIKIVFTNFIALKGTVNPETNLYASEYTGKDILITYSATLNEKAVIGETGNTNTAKLTYSNNPNKTPEGENEPGPNDTNVTGDSPEKTTVTYTTGVKLTKVDTDTTKKLAGATFRITGQKLNKVVTITDTFEEAGADYEGPKYWKLADGTYTTTDPNSDEVQQAANKDEILAKYDQDSINKVYKPVAQTSVTTVSETVNAEATSGPDGVIIFDGLSEGEYTITEITAPEGYNLLDAPLTLKIKWTAPTADPITKTSKCGWSKEAGTSDGFTFNSTTGEFETDVVNQTGTELPSTGGIGTVIFYVLGSLLVVGCGIVLISKRRMNSTK